MTVLRIGGLYVIKAVKDVATKNNGLLTSLFKIAISIFLIIFTLSDCKSQSITPVYPREPGSEPVAPVQSQGTSVASLQSLIYTAIVRCDSGLLVKAAAESEQYQEGGVWTNGQYVSVAGVDYFENFRPLPDGSMGSVLDYFAIDDSIKQIYFLVHNAKKWRPNIAPTLDHALIKYIEKST